MRPPATLPRKRIAAYRPAIDRERLDTYLASHLIEPLCCGRMRSSPFMVDRQARLLVLIEQAMGKKSYIGDVTEEGVDAERDDDASRPK